MAANLEMNKLDNNDIHVDIHEDEPVLPTLIQPGNLPLFAETELSGSSLNSYPPSPSLLAPLPSLREETQGEIERDMEGPVEDAGSNQSSDTSSIPEPKICRACGPDQETTNEVMLELGCRCAGHMSSMHRKCILQWYSARMILLLNFKCEICEALLHPIVQLEVSQSVADDLRGGRDIIMATLKSKMGNQACLLGIERAATYEELMHLIYHQNVMQPTSQHHHILDFQHPINVQGNHVNCRKSRRTIFIVASVSLIVMCSLIVGIKLWAYYRHK